MPHIVQYQGSKRKLAPQILPYFPMRSRRMVEPFAGMAAMTIAAAHERRAAEYVLNDFNPDIVRVLRCAVETPEALIADYAAVWGAQFHAADGSEAHFYAVRDHFNAGERTAANMLYLLARCVKGSVRYNAQGEFNQSPDKRRHGTNPQTLAQNIRAISKMLKGRTSFSCKDFAEVAQEARQGDLVYMDPPYQGVSNVRDHRYIAGITVRQLVEVLEMLNSKGVDYVVSYDGKLGDKTYGNTLPDELGLKRIDLNAGLSTQALFLGQKLITTEALYLSPTLCKEVRWHSMPAQQLRLAL